MEELSARIAEEPMWLQIWVGVLGLSMLPSAVFAFFDRRAHWVFTAFLANILIMPALFDSFGYSRILGLSHIIVWTPLLPYLYLNRNVAPEKRFVGIYLRIFFVLASISLIIDYIDVVRYLLGDRS